MASGWRKSDEKQHVVIIGAGFGGLACIRKLRKSPSYRITLIDRNPYHLFAPLLYQVATAGLPVETEPALSPTGFGTTSCGSLVGQLPTSNNQTSLELTSDYLVLRL